MMIFCIGDTKRKDNVFFHAFVQSSLSQIPVFSDSPMSQLGAGGSPGEDDHYDRGGTSTGGATNLSIRAFQSLVWPQWKMLRATVVYIIQLNSWSCWKGVCNSWLLNVFPPHKLACRSPQVANCWASTQVELLNFWTIEEAHKSFPSFSAGSCLALLDAVLHGEVKQGPLSCSCVGQEIMVECSRWRIVSCHRLWLVISAESLGTRFIGQDRS